MINAHVLNRGGGGVYSPANLQEPTNQILALCRDRFPTNGCHRSLTKGSVRTGNFPSVRLSPLGCCALVELGRT